MPIRLFFKDAIYLFAVKDILNVFEKIVGVVENLKMT